MELRGLLIGIVLGDGTLSKCSSSSNSRLLLGHSLKQKEYCEHKLQLVSRLLDIEYKAKEYSVYNKSKDKYYSIFQGSTRVDRYLTKLRHLLYPEGTKIINEKKLSYLTSEGLAYWYMDDGGVIINNSRKAVYGTFLSTQCFSREQQEEICEYFKQFFGFTSKVVSHGRGKFRIKINKENSEIFLAAIRPYILEHFAYKATLDYEEYKKLQP